MVLPSSFASQRLRLLEFYSAHRLVIQRILNASFLIYLLGATFNSAGSRVGKRHSKKGNKDNRKGKQNRVAVCRSFVKYFLSPDKRARSMHSSCNG